MPYGATVRVGRRGGNGAWAGTQLGLPRQPSSRLFDAFSNSQPLPDNYTFGHYTPCRSHYSFGITTNWWNDDTIVPFNTGNVGAVQAYRDLAVWINWQPSGILGVVFAMSNAANSGTLTASQPMIIGAPQFFPTANYANINSPIYASGTPVQARPIRTSVKVTCTTQTLTRQGGIQAIVLPQNIIFDNNQSSLTYDVTSFGSINSTTANAAFAYGNLNLEAVTEIQQLVQGQGSEFISATSMADNAIQWDLTPASFSGFHEYLPWAQVPTLDRTPQTFSGVNNSVPGDFANAMSYNDLTAFSDDQQKLNMSNLLLIIKGAGFGSAQTYNVEIASMIAARFPANSLLANNALLPRRDPGDSVLQGARNKQASGSPATVSGPMAGRKVREA